jgi:uncharacterized membrane protein YGL010W
MILSFININLGVTMGNSVNKNSVKYWFTAYLKDHSTLGNIRTHYIGVPAVTLSLVGLLNEISFNIGTLPMSIGLMLIIFSMVWYFILDFKLASLILFPIALTYYAATLISFKAHIAIQVLAWVLQLLGHYKYEGKSPAFFKSLPQLLIGPLFIFAKSINYNWRK